MGNLKKDIQSKRDSLYKDIENNINNSEILNNALSIIDMQSDYISQLEKMLNKIEDMYILGQLEERIKNDNGIRYTLEDLREANKKRNMK